MVTRCSEQDGDADEHQRDGYFDQSVDPEWNDLKYATDKVSEQGK